MKVTHLTNWNDIISVCLALGIDHEAYEGEQDAPQRDFFYSRGSWLEFGEDQTHRVTFYLLPGEWVKMESAFFAMAQTKLLKNFPGQPLTVERVVAFALCLGLYAEVRCGLKAWDALLESVTPFASKYNLEVGALKAFCVRNKEWLEVQFKNLGVDRAMERFLVRFERGVA